MNWIVITSPSFFDGEVNEIKRLVDEGVDTIHLRKPDSDIRDCRRILDSLSNVCLSRIVLHDHFSLCEEYGLKGVHLNRRNPLIPVGHKGSVSRSCHSLEEVRQFSDKSDYVFLSPIFNSISKEGYNSAFSHAQLKEAAERGIINNKVIALGGVSLSNIPIVRSLGFGGVACLGDIWSRVHSDTYAEYLRSMHMALHGLLPDIEPVSCGN